MPYFTTIVAALKSSNKLRFYALLLALSFTPSSFAQKLIIYTDNWAPYNFEDNGELVGISTEIIQVAMSSAGIDYEIKMRPWARAYKTVTRTPNTALFTIQRSEKREPLFKWAGPIVDSDIYLYKLKSRTDIELRQFSDLRRFQTGVLNKGAVYQYLVSRGLNTPNLHVHSRADNHLNLLFAGRVDLIPGDEIDLKYQLKNGQFDHQELEKAFLLYPGRYHIAFNKEVPDELVNKVQQALDQLNNTTLSHTIVNHYVETNNNNNKTLN